MASQFIGLQMLVTVRDPPARLRGTVSEVEAGMSLTLSNVWVLDANRWEPRLTIRADDIVDLSEIPGAPSQQDAVDAPSAVLAAPPPHHPQPGPASASPAREQKPYVDPAILSMGRRPVGPSHAPSSAKIPGINETRDRPHIIVPSIQLASTSRDATPTHHHVSDTLESLELGDDSEMPVPAVAADVEEQQPAEVAAEDVQGASQRRKRRQRKQPATGAGRGSVPEDLDASPQPPPRTKQSGRGKGWRQTPMLQSASSFQPYHSLKKHGSKGRAPNDSGWASEDVTDVQEMGDFDFEGGLAKFDKRNLFEQMRRDDQVEDAERLVSHNRQARPKPGTSGGKNLHYSENVLDVAPATAASAAPLAGKQAKDKPQEKKTPKEAARNDFWNSEADDGALNNGGERMSGRELGSRQSSRRGESKMSASRRSQSRKASGPAAMQAPNRANSGVSVQDHPRSRAARRRRQQKQQPAAFVNNREQLTSSTGPPPGFYQVATDRRVETVSALQMLNLENIAHNELGLTEEMMTENAGRGAAEVTLAALSDPAVKLRHTASSNAATGSTAPPPPTVVVLAGNNKSGIRAVAAGRHLRNKGVNVLVCVVGIERGERELLEDMRQQVRLFRAFGGRVVSKADLFEHLRKASIPTLTIDTPRTSLSSLANPAPVTLIVDALLGLAISFEELRTGDQATVYELIEWANRNEAFVLAVDVPSGIDPSSGKVSVIDGNQLYVKPRYVVAMGAPKRGLLETMAAADEGGGQEGVLGAGGGGGGGGGSGGGAVPDDSISEWKLFVADIGLGAAVWKKAGTKIRRGINFDDRWVVEMRYQGSPAEEYELV